jgi:signal transduction histidine kinase
VPVSVDLFRDAINNLLSNAIKYGPNDRVIVIELCRNNMNVEFCIVDHGYGIPPEAQEKVFTEFYRVRSVHTAKETGTGLGLAHVKEIMAQHSGSVSFESTPEIGCKFTLLFPTSEAA